MASANPNTQPQLRRRNFGSRMERTRGKRKDAGQINGVIPSTGTAEDEIRFRRVFENDLIFDKIASYLPFSDKKVFSQVSHLTLSKIRNNAAFADSARLIVNDDSYDTVRQTEFHWKTILFELGSLQEKAQLIALKRVLRHVEAIKILDRSEIIQISNTKWANSLMVLISSSPNLKILSLENDVIDKKFLNVLKKSQVVKALENLKELEIFKRKFTDIPCIRQDLQADFAKVLQEICSKTSNLQAFHFGKIDTRNSKEIAQAIVDIVEKSRETLTHLTLSIQTWSNEKLKALVCPSLSSLNIVFKSKDASIVKLFLGNQPLLSTLKIQSLDEFPLSVLPVVESRSSELKKLRLKLPQYTDDGEWDDEYLVDWSFLSNLTQLEEFTLIRTVDKEIHHDYDELNLLDYFSVASALQILPAQMKKIYLRGLEVVRPGQDEDAATLMNLLARFTNLTELSIFECPNFINDELLQFICSNLTKLRVFGLSKCDTLTSFGYTGVRQDLDSGISMRNFKGLRKLKLEDCTVQDPETLLEFLRFPEMRVLELDCGSTFRITPEFATQVARQNPCLEYLKGWFEGDEKVITDKIKKFCPRFKNAVWKGSGGNSDAMTAYGYDAEGNPTAWMYDSYDELDDGDFLDSDDYDFDDEYEAEFDEEDYFLGMHPVDIIHHHGFEFYNDEDNDLDEELDHDDFD